MHRRAASVHPDLHPLLVGGCEHGGEDLLLQRVLEIEVGRGIPAGPHRGQQLPGMLSGAVVKLTPGPARTAHGLRVEGPSRRAPKRVETEPGPAEHP